MNLACTSPEQDLIKAIESARTTWIGYEALALLEASNFAALWLSKKSGHIEIAQDKITSARISLAALVTSGHLAPQASERFEIDFENRDSGDLAFDNIDGATTFYSEQALNLDAPIISIAILSANAMKKGTSVIQYAAAKPFWESAFALLRDLNPKSHDMGILGVLTAEAQTRDDAKYVSLSAAIEVLERDDLSDPNKLSMIDSSLLSNAFKKRGQISLNVKGKGYEAAFRDYGEALKLSEKFEGAKQALSHKWQNEVAAIYTSRAGLKADMPGYGPEEALKDYDKAIQRRSELARKLGGDFPEDWAARHAITLLNCGELRSKIPTQKLSDADLNLSEAIKTLSDLIATSHSGRRTFWRYAMSIAYMNRANVRAKVKTIEDLEVLQDYCDGIETLETLKRDLGDKFPKEYLNGLAGLYGNRARFGSRSKAVSKADVIADYDATIDIYERMVEASGDRAPPSWINNLALSLMNRAVAKRALNEIGPLAALEDYTAAINYWKTDNFAQKLGKEHWLSTHVGAAVSRIECARKIAGTRRLNKVPEVSHFLIEALELFETAAIERLRLVSQSVTRAEQIRYIHGGRGISTFGAWLYAQLDQPIRALQFLEKQRSYLLKDNFLGNPQALAPYLGSERSKHVASLQRKIHGLRLKETSPRHNGLSPNERLALITAVDEIVELLQNEDRQNLVPNLSEREIKALAPKNGVLLVPVSSKLGTIIFIVRQDHPVTVFELPELTSNLISEWVEDLFAAEHRYISNDADIFRSGEHFNTVLHDQTRQYWDLLMGPITRHLSENLGLESAEPLTIAIQGSLDALPLHAAKYEIDGKVRYLIEDRVIRFAPGLTALNLMRRRYITSQSDKNIKSIAAFIAPVWKNITPQEDLNAAREIEWPLIQTLDWQDIQGPYIGESASLERFLSIMSRAVEAPVASDILLSTHAYFDKTSPDNSGFFLIGDDGERTILSVNDLLGLKPAMGLRHVAMPACQSAQSSLNTAADESIGLVGAMIQAGAASITSCLYPVSDKSAAMMMPAIFKEYIDNGCDNAEAMRAVVLKCLSGVEKTESSRRALRLSLPVDSSHQVSQETGSNTPEDITTLRLLDWAAFKPVCYGKS